MLQAAAVNPAFLERQKSGWIWGKMQSDPSLSVLCCSESSQNSTAIVCKGYKLGRDVTGSSFPITSQCWTTSPYYPRGSLVWVHLWFFHAVMHFCSMLQLPTSSMQLLSSPQRVCGFIQAQLILGAVCWGKHWLGCFVLRGRRNHPEVPCCCPCSDGWTRPRCSLNRSTACPRLDFIPCLCWEKVAKCAAGRCPACPPGSTRTVSHVPPQGAH